MNAYYFDEFDHWSTVKMYILPSMDKQYLGGIIIKLTTLLIFMISLDFHVV